MKVALVAPYSLSIAGGVGTHALDLAASLRLAGHPTVVLGPLDGPKPDPWVRGVGRSVAVAINGSTAHPGFSPGMARRTKEILAEEAPDVLHVHEPLLPSVSLLATLVAAGIPVVASFHAAAPDHVGYRLAGPLLRRVAQRFDVVAAVSSAAAATVEPVLRRHCILLPNGLRTDGFVAARQRAAGLPQPRPTVLFLGRFEPRKGLDVLLDAWPTVRRAVPEALLRVAGAGDREPYRERLEHVHADEVGVPDDAAKADVFAQADVYAAPATHGESFGYVLLEAMAAGTAVVAAANPGYASLARHGHDALLVPPGDAHALGLAIAEALRDAALRARLVEGGAATAARHDWTVLLPAVLAAYRSAGATAA